MGKFTNPPSKGKESKPAKPYPEFPLFPHATKRWAKKIRGRLHYFKPWNDPGGSLQSYLDQKDALHAGRRPIAKPDALTTYQLAGAFLEFKKNARDAGELTTRSFKEYAATTRNVLKAFGRHRLVIDLIPGDFDRLRASWVKKGWGSSTIGNEVQRTRAIFKYAIDAPLTDRFVHFGPGFKKPSRKLMRRHRAAKGKQMFEPAEIQELPVKAGPTMRAMILLGPNCGFGNADCGKLPIEAIDLEAGWVNFPRPKTGIPRRCWLWPETEAAIRTALNEHTEPKDASPTSSQQFRDGPSSTWLPVRSGCALTMPHLSRYPVIPKQPGRRSSSRPGCRPAADVF
jgi:hypothetical protein